MSRTDTGVQAFHRRWLWLDEVRTTTKDPGVEPAFDEALRQSLVYSGQRMTWLAMWDRKADQKALFSGKLIGDRAMSAFYASLPDGRVRGAAAAGRSERYGILTLPAFLAGRPTAPVPVAGRGPLGR